MLKDISVEKLDAELSRLDGEIKKILDLQKQREELQKIRDVVMEYLSLERRKDSPLFTEQARRRLRVMVEFPLLSLSLGSSGIVKMTDAYEDNKSLFEGFEDGRPSYARTDEDSLASGGFADRIEKLLKDFKLKEVSLV